MRWFVNNTLLIKDYFMVIIIIICKNGLIKHACQRIRYVLLKVFQIYIGNFCKPIFCTCTKNAQCNLTWNNI